MKRPLQEFRDTKANVEALTSPHVGAVAYATDTYRLGSYDGAAWQWGITQHPGAAGYALVSDGTDILWDQTPTWTGGHVFQAGLAAGTDGTVSTTRWLDIDGSLSQTSSIGARIVPSAASGCTSLVGGYMRNDVDASVALSFGYGNYIAAPIIASGGSITNQYGLVIENMKISGVTNAWGVYQSGANTKNYFQGTTLIGTPTLTGTPQLTVLSTGEQLRLSYDASNYAKFEVASDGALTVTTVDAAAAQGHIALMPDGNVGIGTATPGARFEVLSTAADSAAIVNSLSLVKGGWLGYGFRGYTGAAGAVKGAIALKRNPAGDTTFGRGSLLFLINTAGDTSNADLTDERMRVDYSGNVLVGTTTSHGGKLEVLSTTEQLRLDYDAANYASFTVDASGYINIAPSGERIGIGGTPSEMLHLIGSAAQVRGWAENQSNTGYTEFSAINDGGTATHRNTFGVGGSATGNIYQNSGYFVTGSSLDKLLMQIANTTSGYLAIAIGNSTDEKLRLDLNGNLLLGATAAGANADTVLLIANGTAPSGSPANAVQLYAEDVSASSELKVRDEAGNITTLSPHDSVTGEWIFYSENMHTGRRVRVNMEQMVRAFEELTGQQFMFETMMEVQ